MGQWITDPATGNQTWQGSQYLPNGGPVYAWGDLIDPNNPDGGRYAKDTWTIPMKKGLPSYESINVGTDNYFKGDDGYYYKQTGPEYNGDGIVVSGNSADTTKRYSPSWVMQQPGAIPMTVTPDYNTDSGGMNLGMLAAFAGIGGLGLSGLLEGIGSGSGGLSWLGNSGLASIPEAVSSLPAAAGTAAGAAGSGAMDWTDFVDTLGDWPTSSPAWNGDLNSAIEAIQNGNYTPEMQQQIMQALNNSASGGDWQQFLDSGALGDPSTTSSLWQSLQNLPSGTSNLLKGLTGNSDLMKALGGLGAGALGAYASNKQTNALTDMAQRYEGYGAPYRARLASLYSNPDEFLNSKEVQTPVQQGTNALMRSLSTQGNPWGSGNALQQGQSYAADQLFGKLGQEKDRLAGFGGLASYNAAAPTAATNAIGSSGNTYNAIGSAMGNIFNPPQTAAQQMSELAKALKGY